MSSPGRQPLRVRTRRVVGDPDAVRTALAWAHAQGRLVGLCSPAQLADGRVSITAELLEPAPDPARRTVKPSGGGLCPWLLGTAVLAGLAAAVGVVWLLVLGVLALIAMVTAAIAWVGTHLVVILVVLGLLLACCGGGGCAGIHCGGCRR